MIYEATAPLKISESFSFGDVIYEAKRDAIDYRLGRKPVDILQLLRI